MEEYNFVDYETLNIGEFEDGRFGCVIGSLKNGEIDKDGMVGFRRFRVKSEIIEIIEGTENNSIELHNILKDIYCGAINSIVLNT